MEPWRFVGKCFLLCRRNQLLLPRMCQIQAPNPSWVACLRTTGRVLKLSQYVVYTEPQMSLLRRDVTTSNERDSKVTCITFHICLIPHFIGLAFTYCFIATLPLWRPSFNQPRCSVRGGRSPGIHFLFFHTEVSLWADDQTGLCSSSGHLLHLRLDHPYGGCKKWPGNGCGHEGG